MKHGPGVLCVVRDSCADPVLRGLLVVIARPAVSGERFQARGSFVKLRLVLSAGAGFWFCFSARANEPLPLTVQQWRDGHSKPRDFTFMADALPLAQCDLKPISGPGISDDAVSEDVRPLPAAQNWEQLLAERGVVW